MNQRDKVFTHLKAGGRITSLSALTMYGIISLPKRICEIRDMGYRVLKTRRIVDKADGTTARIIVYSRDHTDIKWKL